MYFLLAASASQAHFKDEKTFKKEQRRKEKKRLDWERERQRCGDKGLKGAWQCSKIGKMTF